jgi:GT2 family glycosyltransferase
MTAHNTGFVVIGRNEGERLLRCLRSVLHRDSAVVYVDSNSTDGSAERAAALGARVLQLDVSTPFTAARARNAGLYALLDWQPGIEQVQFVDGDCEVVPTWLSAATAFLANNPRVAVVCGRRRERFPDRSIYNRLCDVEWDTPVGESKACGGDALMRVEALTGVGGYRDALIAGEEPELCVRLRAAGWKIWRLDAEMTRHDAAMTHWRQWWKRTVRGGYAFAAGAHLHGAPPERFRVRESRSALIWGIAVPALLVAAVAISPAAWWAFALYPLQVLRLSLEAQGTPTQRVVRGMSLVLGKFAEAMGLIRFHYHRVTGATARLIEYK